MSSRETRCGCPDRAAGGGRASASRDIPLRLPRHRQHRPCRRPQRSLATDPWRGAASRRQSQRVPGPPGGSHRRAAGAPHRHGARAGLCVGTRPARPRRRRPFRCECVAPSAAAQSLPDRAG
eukprot:5931016-Prymnesium_polylepis.1